MRHWYSERGFVFRDENGAETDDAFGAVETVERSEVAPGTSGEWIVSVDEDDGAMVHPLFGASGRAAAGSGFIRRTAARILDFAALRGWSSLARFLIRKFYDGGWGRVRFKGPGVRFHLPRSIVPMFMEARSDEEGKGTEIVMFRPCDVMRVRLAPSGAVEEPFGIDGLPGFGKRLRKLSGDIAVFVLVDSEREEMETLETDRSFNPLRISAYVAPRGFRPAAEHGRISLPAGTIVYMDTSRAFSENMSKLMAAVEA